MTKAEMVQRTKEFGLEVIAMVDALPRGISNNALASQLIRSATSVGANYRSACRGRSGKEFCAKLGVSLEECDESGYWLEVLRDSGKVTASAADPLIKESDELCAILFTSITTARKNDQ